MIHPYGATPGGRCHTIAPGGAPSPQSSGATSPHPALDLPESPRNDRTARVPAACSLPAAGGERPRGRWCRAKHAISAPATLKGTCAVPGTGRAHRLQPKVRVPPGARSPRTASLIHRSILRCGSDGKSRRLKISDRSGGYLRTQADKRKSLGVMPVAGQRAALPSMHTFHRPLRLRRGRIDRPGRCSPWRAVFALPGLAGAAGARTAGAP